MMPERHELQVKLAVDGALIAVKAMACVSSFVSPSGKEVAELHARM